eukprot:Pgem_evm1s5029
MFDFLGVNSNSINSFSIILRKYNVIALRNGSKKVEDAEKLLLSGKRIYNEYIYGTKYYNIISNQLKAMGILTKKLPEKAYTLYKKHFPN